jgi:hypothetical protein
MHELGHAVGLHHEHNRLDRDKYIKINWNNIKSREERAFCPIRKERDQNIGKYDFDSIMHYPWWAFGKKVANNKTLVTIQAATGVGVKIKSRIDPSLSSGDRYTLAKLYGWPVTPLTPDSSTGGGGQTSISCTADGEVAVKYEKNHEDTKFWLASGARVRIVKAERDERHRLWYQIRDKYGRVGWTLRQWLRCT